jgi:hypothetical protein
MGFPLDFGISAIYFDASVSLKLYQVSALFASPTAMNCGSGLRFSPQSNAISPRKREEVPWPMPNAPVALLD